MYNDLKRNVRNDDLTGNEIVDPGREIRGNIYAGFT
jgi:hypothetical protein